jgi:branched-subunit amino acid aminotransferase/4-amino-4-deoxychorismate lyase
VDGRFSEPAAASVSALDAGFLLGDGLFESLRAVDGMPYLLDRHLQRLLHAAVELSFPGVPITALAVETLETLRRAGLSEAYLRVTISRGPGGIGLGPDEGRLTRVIAALPLPAQMRAAGGIRAKTIRCESERVAPRFKSTSWQPAVVARRQIEASDTDEGIYISPRGTVLEGLSSNLFAVLGGRLATPAVSDCLPGITRARVIELAREAGAEAEECELSLTDLEAADAVFLTNAVQGIRRVQSIDGESMGGGASELLETLELRYGADRHGSRERIPALTGDESREA